jgi:Ribosomal RNA-processing protein 7 (RRP7) C-terminal domain
LYLLVEWKSDYDNQIVSGLELQAEIDSFMDQHDKRVSDEQMLQKEAEGQADEDGWVTVTKKGRKPGFARKESVEQKVLEREGKKKTKKQLLNFYTFQIRESKMNRKKFVLSCCEFILHPIFSLHRSRRTEAKVRGGQEENYPAAAVKTV